MPAQKIVLPADSTGKAIYTQERTVTGPGTVQVQYVIETSARVVSGVQIAHTGAHVVQATAQNGTATGFWWLYNLVGSTTLMAFRRCEFASSQGTALLTPTAPRIMLKAFTFTGVPGGAAIAARKADTTQPAPAGRLMSTQVTSVVTLAEDLFAFFPVFNQSSSSGGPATPGVIDWLPDEDGQVVLRAGEGIVCYQPDAGTASDTRRFTTNIAWTEFTTP